MFFLFQLIADPDQPGAALFRDHIKRAVSILEEAKARNMPVAFKALEILRLVEPLSMRDASGQKDTKKKDVLDIIRSMAFPCHDAPPMKPMRSPASTRRPLTGSRGHSSGHSSGHSGMSSSLSPPLPIVDVAHVGLGIPLSSPPHANTSQYQQQGSPYAQAHTSSPYAPSAAHQHHQGSALSHSTTHPPPPHPLSLTTGSTSLSYQYQTLPPNPYASMAPPQPGPVYASGPAQMTNPGVMTGGSGQGAAMELSVDTAMSGNMPMQATGTENWGHTIGLGPEQWAQFMDVMHRPA